VLVIGSSKKQKVNILWKIKPKYGTVTNITIIDPNKKSTISIENTGMISRSSSIVYLA